MSSSENLKQALQMAKGLYKELKPFRSALKTGQKVLDHSFTRALDAINGSGIEKSSNENVNKIKAVAKVWNQELIPLTQKDENFWINWSKVNALDSASVRQAKSDLENLNRKLMAISEAVPALITLVAGLSVAQGWSDKAAFAYAPSLGALEYMAVNSAITELKAVQGNAKSVSRKLENCIKIL